MPWPYKWRKPFPAKLKPTSKHVETENPDLKINRGPKKESILNNKSKNDENKPQEKKTKMKHPDENIQTQPYQRQSKTRIKKPLVWKFPNR
ncbi:MAG: hypothetical protein PWQ82_589 [Thermosediminibacterales bacterium]|nr:hypothetical protein [Thermosediminibacterales bacterium]MDK2835515.1 hypothetical protein [Thermosediminibacterales bacterium]